MCTWITHGLKVMIFVKKGQKRLKKGQKGQFFMILAFQKVCSEICNLTEIGINTDLKKFEISSRLGSIETRKFWSNQSCQVVCSEICNKFERELFDTKDLQNLLKIEINRD